MACPEWQDKLIDFVLEELPPEAGPELERHVEHCAACTSALNEYSGLQRVMKAHFADREMPAHLVLVPERPTRLPWGFLSRPWGAAALGGALAAFFLIGLILGGVIGPAHGLFVRERAEKAALTRVAIEALVEREVSARMAQQKADLQIQNANLLATVRQERAQNLAQLGQHLEYLQSAQNAMWKETQQQDALVQLIARNSLDRAKVPIDKNQE
jgi:anti-sigma factor RsiW